MTNNRAGGFPLRTFALLGVVLLGFGAAGYGCGGGGDKEDLVALCNQNCDKAISLCFADAGAAGTAAKQLCTQQCSMPDVTNPSTCKNSSAIASAIRGCLSKNTCAEYTACVESVPECERSTGGGGTSGGGGGATGSGGSTGGGGAGGTATCADLLACCNAANDPQVKSQCMAGYNAAMDSDAACAAILDGIKSNVCP